MMIENMMIDPQSRIERGVIYVPSSQLVINAITMHASAGWQLEAVMFDPQRMQFAAFVVRMAG